MKKINSKYRLLFTCLIIGILITVSTIMLTVINMQFFTDSFTVLIIIVLIYCIVQIYIMKEKLISAKKKLHTASIQLEQLKKTQRCLSVSEKNYTLLFQSMLNGFFILEPVFNEDGKLIDIRFLDVNPSFEYQTGIKAKEIIGRTWIETFKYPNQDLSTYHNILYSGIGENFETYYAQGDIYYLVNAFKIAENLVGVIFDNVTEYKKAIKQITMLNEELEQHIIQRTDELQIAIRELEAFAYTVSHDLKSPLRAIDGYSRIILEDFDGKLDDDGRDMLNNIRNICNDMIEMINKLLKYSITVKADIDKEKINTEQMFNSIFNELKLEHGDRELKLIIETGLPLIFADKILLRQVIYNILSNAIKFTKYIKNPIIIVGCTITGEEYIFYVKDNGVGFDMDYSGKLFSIFERLHTNDEFEGSGIGLVTIKKIIQKHGGRVWIEGKPDKGAAVYFTLPFI